VVDRFDRYRRTDGWNRAINARQFGWLPRSGNLGIGGGQQFLPDTVADPDVTYRSHLTLDVGGTPLELHHARGETDDHTWAWLPDQRAICAGDFLIWNFPNAGNPQKVQRYPLEWAQALRRMTALAPSVLCPGHGPPILGEARVRQALSESAELLESLHAQTLALMNSGARLDDVLANVKAPEHLLARPYLRPVYDEPEFIVRNLWRLYGGWYDGNPAHLKPARERALAEELASLCGGAAKLAARGEALADSGELALACHLLEMASQAAPADPGIAAARASVYRRRAAASESLMARGIFEAAARESKPG
jgi:alkyl sulfatase BDS1-like metallo-beta-lactamase superfamily hydrolase